MSRGFLIALAGGLLGAILFLSVRTGTPGAMTFAILAPLPLFAIGLMQGLAAAAIASLVASVAVLATAGGFPALMFAVRVVAPVLIVVRQALLSRPGAQPGTTEWYPPGLLVGWLTGFGLLILTAGFGWYLGREGGIEGAMRAYFETAFSALTVAPNDPRVQAIMEVVPRYLPGTMVVAWLLIAMINGVLAQTGLARAGYARRPTPAFAALDLPRWLAAALLVALALILMPGQLGVFGRNATVVLSLPFFLLGLATVHTVSRRLTARGPVLAVFYLLVFLVIWPVGLFVVILGIIEQWFALRRRFGPSAASREDE